MKAAAGCGGKGMRVVREKAELAPAAKAARSEAGSAFADDRIYLEKAIVRPRHIEIQVLADRHGNAIHLFERECSIQRRHQKVIEESPSPSIDADLRQRAAEHGEAAVGLEIAVDAVALTGMAADHQHAVGALLKGPNDVVGRHRSRAHHPDRAHVGRVLKAADTRQIGAGIAAPLAEKGDDPRFKGRISGHCLLLFGHKSTSWSITASTSARPNPLPGSERLLSNRTNRSLTR